MALQFENPVAGLSHILGKTLDSRVHNPTSLGRGVAIWTSGRSQSPQIRVTGNDKEARLMVGEKWCEKRRGIFPKVAGKWGKARIDQEPQKPAAGAG